MKVLVTGGAGFIGSSFVKSLIRKGKEVRVLDSYRRGTASRLSSYKDDIEIINGDIRNKATVKKALKNVDYVYHFAYINGTKNFYKYPYEVLEVGIKGIYNLFDCFKKAPISHFILASSSEVYQQANIIPTPENIECKVPDVFNPRFSYGSGKILSEILAIHSKNLFDKLTIFRPHNVYGPDMGNDHVVPELINKIKKIGNNKTLKIQGTGQETRSFIYIDDFIRALNLVVSKTRKFQLYNIGTDEEITIKNLTKKILKNFNQNQVKIISEKIFEGSTVRRCPDVKKLRKLGFTPKINLDKGLKKTIEWSKKS